MEIKEFPPGVKSVLWENTPDEKVRMSSLIL